jgi:acetoin utilization deacetylase AcuC-like enzyme
MAISGWSWSVAFSAAMQAWAHDRFSFPLPAGHRFPLAKYSRLRARLAADGTVGPQDVRISRPATWAELGLVHEHDYLRRVRTGQLSLREQRGLGLPWSPALVERGRRSTWGTVEATRDAHAAGLGLNLGGGTHHAGRAVGRGFCLFNDVVLAVAVARRSGLFARALVVDCDVHQGDGTAELLAGDPDAFALSVHSAVNYPFHRATSDLDVDLPAGTGDDAYLAALDGALDRAMAAGPWEHAFYLAGADPWAGDRLGRLALTKSGLLRRDELVLDRLRDHGAAVTVVLAGGYAPDVEDTVDINAATAAAVAARIGRTLAPAGP